MATRSGKHYQELKRRRAAALKDSNFDNSHSPKEKDFDSSLNVSTKSNRELRKTKARVQDSTFDKSNTSITKIDIETATESNWIISDMANKVMTRRSTFDKSNLSNLNGRAENELENDINISNVPVKQLRSKKSKAKDATSDKTNKIIETALEKDEPGNSENNAEIALKRKKKKISKDRSSDKKNASLLNENDNEKDEGPDLDSADVQSKLIKKKKKKVKGGKKKKLKRKLNDEETAETADIKEKEDAVMETTFEKDKNTKARLLENKNTSMNNNNDVKDLNTSNMSNKVLRSMKSLVNDTTFEKEKGLTDTTFEKDPNTDKMLDKDNYNITKDKINERKSKDVESVPTDISSTKSKRKRSDVNLTFDKDKSNDTFDKEVSTSFDTFKKGAISRKSSIKDTTFDKSNTSIHSLTKENIENEQVQSSSAVKRNSLRRQTIEINNSTEKLDATFEKSSYVQTEKRKSSRLSEVVDQKLNTTFDKGTGGGEDSKSSLISSDNSISGKAELSRISITSNESAENIVNTTPLLIESSIDESVSKDSMQDSPNCESPQVVPTKSLTPQTPLRREGTFTKDGPEVLAQSPQTPSRRTSGVMPPAGCTPYHVSKSSQKKAMLNVTRSIEKRLSVEPAPRLTRVMFCSPVDNPVLAAQEKRKIIKSNLKGSNKSFVFDDSASLEHVGRVGRKRSHTHSGAEEARAKRSRLADDMQQSVDRLSRPRTGQAKVTETTPKKSATPYKSKSETKPARTRLPNFAALHQRQFDKMESLDECQERKAKRARQMLTPNGPTNVVDRISPKNNQEDQQSVTKDTVKPAKTDTPTKKLPTLESLRPGFTRFGFKLNLDVNPFSVPPKTDKPKTNGLLQKNVLEKSNGVLARALPSLTGATSVRREIAKQTVMREKSFMDKKRHLNRNENRTIIKGVRTNRRFELQMKLRNIE